VNNLVTRKTAFWEKYSKTNIVPELATVHWILLHAYWNRWSKWTWKKVSQFWYI